MTQLRNILLGAAVGLLLAVVGLLIWRAKQPAAPPPPVPVATRPSDLDVAQAQARQWIDTRMPKDQAPEDKGSGKRVRETIPAGDEGEMVEYEMDASGAETFTSPEGNVMQFGKTDMKWLALPVYPEAKPAKNTFFYRTEHDTTANAEFNSAASLDKVAAWYREKLSNYREVTSQEGGANGIKWTKVEGPVIATVVVMKAPGDQTAIVLTRVEKTAAH